MFRRAKVGKNYTIMSFFFNLFNTFFVICKVFHNFAHYYTKFPYP